MFALFDIGVIPPTFHSDRKEPVEIDKLNKLQREPATLIVVCFNIIGEIPSLPVDFVVSSSICISNIDSSVHIKFHWAIPKFRLQLK